MKRFLETLAAHWSTHGSARWSAWRAGVERRRTIRDLLRRSDPILDDIGYSRAVLEAMLEEPSAEPLHQEARRRSADHVRNCGPKPVITNAVKPATRPVLRLVPAVSADCASPKYAAKSAGAC